MQLPVLHQLLTLIGFGPAVALSADAIPEQVPSPIVVVSEPRESRVLRGDYEVSDHVLLVAYSLWLDETELVARSVLQSGGALTLAREIDTPRWRFDRFVRELTAEFGPERIDLLDEVVDTPWTRDWGPIQITRAGAAMWLDSDYDDSERERDDLAPKLISSRYQVSLGELAWPLDGGAIISNGAGLGVLTLEQLGEQGIVWEDEDLGNMLGQLGCRVSAIVPTLIEEPTRHADMIAQFVSPQRLMLTELVDELGDDSEDKLRMRAAELGIRRAAAVLGIELEIIGIPTPPILDDESPHSFINGLRLADRYLMPSYPELGDAWELEAWQAVQQAMGEVPVVPVEASQMISSGGAIHCTALGLFTQG